jgi:hypothetical protein
MEYLFAIFAITYIVFAIPETGMPLWKLATGLVAIILIVFVLFGVPHAIEAR